ncbi:MAG: hypothetical protein GY953_25975, partial [bacterium]|nr:hypothetical protein [bacterium]
MPRQARTHIVDGTPELVLIFGHGTVRFRFTFSDPKRAEIEASWEIRHVKRLCLQVPVVMWRGARLHLDGTTQAADTFSAREVRREISVSGGPLDATFSLRVPEGMPCRVHYPITFGSY